MGGTDVTGFPGKLAPRPAPAGNRPIPAGIPFRLPKGIPFPGLSVTPGLRVKLGPRPLPVLIPIPVPSPPPGLRPIPMGIPLGAPVVVCEVDDGCDWLLGDDVLVFLTGVIGTGDMDGKTLSRGSGIRKLVVMSDRAWYA